MSKLETNTIDTVSGTSTLQVGSTNTTTITLGASGDTINIPSGATIANSGTATGFGETNTPAWFVKKSAQQSISNNTYTDVTYDTEVVDTDSAFASNVFTVPSGKGGKYIVFGQCRFDTGADFDNIQSIIAVNGTRTLASWGANQYYNFINVTGILDLSAGDVVKHVCAQDSGGSINLGYADQGTVTFFGGFRITT